MVELVFLSVGLTLAFSILVVEFVLRKSNVSEIIRKRVAMVLIILTLLDFFLFLIYVLVLYFRTRGLSH